MVRRLSSRVCWGLVSTDQADAHRMLKALRCNSIQRKPKVLQHGVGGGCDAVRDDAACR